jgi:glycosyltransferase involved in cell wall biosynthesis
MKIAFIVPGGVDRSGEYRVIPALLALIGKLTQHHEVHVYALAQEPEAADWPLAGAIIHNVGVQRRIPRMLAAIRREHRRARFDVIQSIWSGACGFVCALSARLLGVPNLVHLTGGELVRIPSAGYGGQLHLRWRLLERLILRSSTRVTATSAPIVAAAAAIGVSAQRVPLGIDLKTWMPRAPVARLPDEIPRLIHIATLNRVKDQPTLLQALAALRADGRNFRLDVIGDDTLDGRVQRLARELGLEPKITFHGFKTQRELRPLVERSHINVISSLHEAGPFVLLECAALGVPTVGTAVGHLAEWAPEAAVTAPVGDAPGLAREIARLIDDESLRQRVGAAALNAVRQQDVDYTVACFEQLYREVT